MQFCSIFLMLCMNIIVRADIQPNASTERLLDTSAHVQGHLQADVAKVTMLPRLDPLRIMSQCETLQAARKRSSIIRKMVLGSVGVAGAGLLAYGAYHYFAPKDKKNAKPRDNTEKLSDGQIRAMEYAHTSAESEAFKRYCDELDQRKTFSGHLKAAAWHGTETAIGLFICGVILTSFAQGQEQAARLLPKLFSSYSNDFSMMYKKLASNFLRLNEALYAFALQNQEGELSIKSDILYGHFCAQLIVDYTVLLYSLESALAFLFAHAPDSNEDFLQKIRCGADIIDSLIGELGAELELVVNRAEGASLSIVSGHLKNIYVYATKFMCSCGEELYGDSFSPVQ